MSARDELAHLLDAALELPAGTAAELLGRLEADPEARRTVMRYSNELSRQDLAQAFRSFGDWIEGQVRHD